MTSQVRWSFFINRMGTPYLGLVAHGRLVNNKPIGKKSERLGLISVWLAASPLDEHGVFLE